MFRWIGKTYLRLTGWKAVGTPPEIPKYVVAVAPHTSNWDFPILLAVKWALGVDIGFIAKDSLFKGPAGWFFRSLGGIPVDRSVPTDLVAQVADAFGRADRLAIAIAPEGTRSYAEYWHTGFYRIAQAADVPVVLAFIDYETKTAGVGPVLEITGDANKDMERIAEFYADKHGKAGSRMSPVRFR